MTQVELVYWWQQLFTKWRIVAATISLPVKMLVAQTLTSGCRCEANTNVPGAHAALIRPWSCAATCVMCIVHCFYFFLRTSVYPQSVWTTWQCAHHFGHNKKSDVEKIDRLQWMTKSHLNKISFSFRENRYTGYTGIFSNTGMPIRIISKIPVYRHFGILLATLDWNAISSQNLR